MKLEHYYPTFRNILLQEVKETQTLGGLFLPPRATTEDSAWRVIKTGPDCIAVQPGDLVKIMMGIRPQELKLDSTDYGQITEHQIIGYERVSIRTTSGIGSTVSGDSILSSGQAAT
jgi:co-chaperonin GroES (HSP10)